MVKQLKFQYFNINAKLEQMGKLKDRIDKSVKFNTNLRLIILLLILIAQTSLFFSAIWIIDYLGWDLVEPVTFLVQSIIFITGLFFFIKLNRNAISGEKIVESIAHRVKIKKYLKNNFNYLEFEDLQSQRERVKNLINNYNARH